MTTMADVDTIRKLADADQVGVMPRLNVDKDGVAVAGFDVTTYSTDGAEPSRGDPAIAHEHGGAKYQFASAENRDKFKANPEAYLPAFGGYCGKAISENEVWWIDPKNYLVVDGKVVLFYKEDDLDTRQIWLDTKPDERWKDALKHWEAGTNKVVEAGGAVQPVGKY